MSLGFIPAAWARPAFDSGEIGVNPTLRGRVVAIGHTGFCGIGRAVGRNWFTAQICKDLSDHQARAFAVSRIHFCHAILRPVIALTLARRPFAGVPRNSAEVVSDLMAEDLKDSAFCHAWVARESTVHFDLVDVADAGGVGVHGSAFPAVDDLENSTLRGDHRRVGLLHHSDGVVELAFADSVCEGTCFRNPKYVVRVISGRDGAHKQENDKGKSHAGNLLHYYRPLEVDNHAGGLFEMGDKKNGQKPRQIVVEIEGLTYMIESCADVDDLMDFGDFQQCPMCGVLPKNGIFYHENCGVLH